MNRTNVTALVAALPALAGVACARVPPAESPKPEPAAFAIDYRVLRENDAVVLAGHTDLLAHRDGELTAARPAGRAQIDVEPSPREDGSVVMAVRYREVTPDGATLEWKPLVRVARGSSARVTASGEGWTRAIGIGAR